MSMSSRSHRLFDFLGEQALVADLFQRAIRINHRAVVTGGLDHNDFERVIGQIKRVTQPLARLVGLSQSQRRASGPNSER